MESAGKVRFDVFSDEAFRQHLIAKYGLSEDAKVFAASAVGHYPLDADELIKELGDGKGGIDWAYNFDKAVHHIVEIQEDRSYLLPKGLMAIGVIYRENGHTTTSYFLEDVRPFQQEALSTEAELARVADDFLQVKTLQTQHSDALDFHSLSVWQIRDALQAAYELGLKSRGA